MMHSYLSNTVMKDLKVQATKKTKPRSIPVLGSLQVQRNIGVHQMTPPASKC